MHSTLRYFTILDQVSMLIQLLKCLTEIKFYFYLKMFEQFNKTMNQQRRSPRIAAASELKPTHHNETESSRLLRTETSSGSDDTDNETVFTGPALPEARRQTREIQKIQKAEIIRENSENGISGGKRKSKKTDDDPEDESECDDFLRKKTTGLRDLTNCQRKRSILHQVKLY